MGKRREPIRPSIDKVVHWPTNRHKVQRCTSEKGVGMARKRIDFFLDMVKKDDRVVSRIIKNLKKERAFSQAVKDGIMVINELRQGKIDLLLKLHPWIVDKIHQQFPPPAPSNDELIEQFRQMLEQQGRALPDTRDGGFPAMMPANQAAKPALPAPVIKQAAVAASADEISSNFLAFIQ